MIQVRRSDILRRRGALPITTKAFTTEVTVLALLALWFGQLKEDPIAMEGALQIKEMLSRRL